MTAGAGAAAEACRLADEGPVARSALRDIPTGIIREMTTPRAKRRLCGLCGRAFALVMPPGEEETERDRLCPNCLALPAPPEEP